jgi:hypothetical protein
MTSSPARSFYIGVFVLSGLLMALQALQARIFSVTTWYHLSFLVISVAMFGLTLGALRVYKGNEEEQRRDYAKLMAGATNDFGIAAFFGVVGQLVIPFADANAWKTLLMLPVISVFIVPAYYCAGYALSLAMTRAPFPPARTYGWDLIGAAAGCMLAIGLMETVDAPSAVMLVAGTAMLVSKLFDGRKRMQGLAGLIIVLAALNALAPRPFIYPVFIKTNVIKQDNLMLDRWNAISRVTIQNERKNSAPYLWGPSSTLPKDAKHPYYPLHIDGDALTPINKVGGDCRKGHDYIEYDVTNVAHALKGIRKSAVIGLGGGRDVIAACRNGVTDITALDVNKVQVDVLSKIEPFKSYTKVADVPGVKLIHSEARSWFSSHPEEKFDLVQMSLVDTLAATGAGAFALSENGLYTMEGWLTFMNSLNKGGVFTVSRWHLNPDDPRTETERLVSLAAGTLYKMGVTEPRKHMYMALSSRIATLVLGRDPLTPAQLAQMDARSKKMKFRVLLSPNIKTDAFANILAAKSNAELDNIAEQSPFDFSPPTDERPFFFNSIRLTRPWQVYSIITQEITSALVGHARAVLNLYVILGFSLLMVVGTIVWPLRRELAASGAKVVAGGTAWFLLIGLGFMLVEISLLQRLSVYLGHPSYGLSVVLFSLVLATGLGSMVCDSHPLRTANARVGWAVLTAVAIVLAVFAVKFVTVHFAAAALVPRVLLSVAVILPVGMLLGFGFPTGMAIAQAKAPRSAAWLWGVNGAAGVMGSALAIAFNIAWGIDKTMMLAALCYLALAIPALKARHA